MTTQATRRASELRGGGTPWEAVLGVLRREGFSKVDGIRATVDVLGLPLAEAKRQVHDSDAWRDVHEEDDRLLDGLVSEAEARTTEHRR